MIEVLKQMYQLLLTEPHAPAVCDKLEVILRHYIAELESQEPVAYCDPSDPISSTAFSWPETGRNPSHTHTTSLFTSPAQPPHRTEQEPVALQYPQKDIDWQREQQIKAQASNPPQRTWVGLTIEEIAACCRESSTTQFTFYTAIEAKLKQKNGYAEEKNT